MVTTGKAMSATVKIGNVILPTRDPASRWDIQIEDDVVQSIRPSSATESERHAKSLGAGSTEPADLLLPALCHPHVHLDKAYLLTSHQPTHTSHLGYSDLMPQSGSFSEALSSTAQAKERYDDEDLYLRGSQFLAASHIQGVTSLRAFVEVDSITRGRPLHVARRLRDDFSHLIETQICVFAQEPLFSTGQAEANRNNISEALDESARWIDAVGTAPYVEQTMEASIQNMDWAVEAALKYNLHIDFHLDYNLDPPISSIPLIYSVIDVLETHQWVPRADKSKTIVFGHCTQLSAFSHSHLQQLAQRIKFSGLPIYFVGLPTSDLYMMGRQAAEPESSLARPRGTLHVPSLIGKYGLKACLGINNVGNAFTPYGTGDPLHLASWGVGVYHAGTVADAKMLYSCVSWRARQAIGLGGPLEDGELVVGCRWQPMLKIKNRKHVFVPGQRARHKHLRVPGRSRINFTDIIWDPPDTSLRSIVGGSAPDGRRVCDDDTRAYEDSYAVQ